MGNKEKANVLIQSGHRRWITYRREGRDSGPVIMIDQPSWRM